MVKIRIFGTGVEILQPNIQNHLWKKIINNSHYTSDILSQIIFDTDSYRAVSQFNLKSWEAFDSLLHIKGVLIDKSGIIEMWSNGKKKRKIPIINLVDNNFLFPMYDIQLQEQGIVDSEKEVLIVEKEIGLIANYILNDNKPDINFLRFFVKSFEIPDSDSLSILEKITYKGRLLVSSKKDTLVTSQFVLT